MKKFLLFAAAAIVAVSANAQLLSKKNLSLKSARQNVVVSTTDKKLVKQGMIVKDAKNYEFSLTPFVSGKWAKAARGSQAIKEGKISFKAAQRKAGTVQESYEAYGTDNDGANAKWTMTSSVIDGKTLFTNVIPELGGDLTNITVEYTISDNVITIAPQFIGEYEGTYEGQDYHDYLFLLGATDDGSITMTLNEDGSISTEDDILYGGFSEKAFDPTFVTYTGYYEYISKISYMLPGQIPVPVVFYEPSGLYLHKGISPSWYAYNASQMYIPADAETSFLNYTQDAVDTWSWSMDKLDNSTGEVAETLTATTANFSINTNPNEVYLQPILTASYMGQESDPYQWSVRRGKTGGYVFVGGQMDGQFSDGTYSQITKCDPANRVTAASFMGTPTVNSKNYNLSSLIFYQGKPAAPLYFEGISLWVGSFTKTDDFKLTCKIVKVTRDPETLRITMGDVIAQADVDKNDITLDEEDASDVWALLNWNEFSVEDEEGLSEALPYIQIKDEFAIVFEGWNNGTFTAKPIIEYTGDMVNTASTTSLYLTQEGSDAIYGFFQNYAHPYASFKGAIYGCLHTTDATNVTISNTGGQASIHIEPMFSGNDETTGNPTTALWLAEDSEALPDWLTVGFANETYTETEYSYDLVFNADALPEGVEGRAAKLTFEQWGAQLEVTVTQGTVTGIEVTTKTVKTSNTPMFNLAGQRVDKNYKGIVIKNGNKFIVK